MQKKVWSRFARFHHRGAENVGLEMADEACQFERQPDALRPAGRRDAFGAGQIAQCQIDPRYGGQIAPQSRLHPDADGLKRGLRQLVAEVSSKRIGDSRHAAAEKAAVNIGSVNGEALLA